MEECVFIIITLKEPRQNVRNVLRTFLLAGLVLITHIASALYCCTHWNVSILKACDSIILQQYIILPPIIAESLLTPSRLTCSSLNGDCAPAWKKEKNFREKSTVFWLNIYNSLQIICWHTWSTDGQCVNLVGRWVNLWVFSPWCWQESGSETNRLLFSSAVSTGSKLHVPQISMKAQAILNVMSARVHTQK